MLISAAALAAREDNVPYVNVQILEGATREQKARIVHDITQSLVETLGKKPQHIHIVIQDIKPCDWGFARALTDAPEQQMKDKKNG